MKILLYFKNIYIVLFIFISIEASVKLAGLDNAGTDFKSFYFPKAQNLLNNGNVYSLPDGTKFISDGNIEKYGSQPPVYPVLLSLILKVGGGLTLIYIINVFLLTLSILIFFKSFIQAGFKENYIYISMFILILNPVFFFIPAYYTSESLFTFIFSCFIYLFIKSFTEKKLYLFHVALAIFVLAVLTRSIVLWLLPVIIPVIFINNNFSVKTKIIYMFFLVLYQISIINISESKNSSSYLCRSIYDGFRRFPDNEISKQIVETTNPYSINWQSKFINKNIELFLEKPVDYIQLILSKYFRVWYATDSGKYQNILLLFQLFHLIVYLIMLLFLLLQKIKNIFIISFVLIITYITIIATFNLSIVRYISPFAALYIISSVYFCGEFFQNLKPKILHGI